MYTSKQNPFPVVNCTEWEKITVFQFRTRLVMAPRRKGLSNEEILKLLNELSENDSCDENTFEDKVNFVINDGKTIGENVYNVSLSESSSSD
jgi:hypothetical protein